MLFFFNWFYNYLNYNLMKKEWTLHLFIKKQKVFKIRWTVISPFTKKNNSTSGPFVWKRSGFKTSNHTNICINVKSHGNYCVCRSMTRHQWLLLNANSAIFQLYKTVSMLALSVVKWVWALIGSNQKLLNWYLLLSTQH
jgi:hypothetical protein